MKKLNYKLNFWQTAVAIVVITLATTVFSVAIQPGAFYKSLMDIVSRPLCILLNAFPV